VLWLLIGWQFALAEFVGGAIMLALLAVVLPRVVPAAEQHRARAALARSGSATDPHAGHGDPGAAQAGTPWWQRIRSPAGWSDAAGYTVSDLTMLRKELAIGFVVAGFADAAVPVDFWRSLFVTGHGFWSVLENVVLGPFLAIISFVCSVGNVPLAAALWTGGISFGGTIAFVFADLVALPLLLIYRRFYGTRLTLKLLATFWATMSLAGLATEHLFAAAGILPTAGTAEHGMVGRDVWGWNHTTVLDVVALVAFAAIYWLSRNRSRFGGGSGYAKDPVCGMQVQVAHAPATAVHDGRTSFFCSDHCAHRFTADPSRFDGDGAAEGSGEGAGDGGWVDPVCGMTVPEARWSAEHDGVRYAFCGPGCRERFARDPSAVLQETGGR
jgi:YHS domain-containing protein/uncharacterized membrane protein YraQ (UPF0718 family)